MFARQTRYLERHWGFREMVDRARDSRPYPDIPSSAIFLSVFGMHARRLGSLNRLEAELRLPARWEALIGKRKPSAEAVGYALARWDLAGLRMDLAEAGKMGKRKKVFRRLYPDSHWVAAIDGVETYRSRKRCCAECLTRTVKVGKEKKEVTEYYHREVALQMIGVTPVLILDAEPLVKGDTEVSAALRMIERFREICPRFIDVLSFDAFYLQAPFTNKVLDMGYGVVIVLKQETRDLYKDAQGLFEAREAQEKTSWVRGESGYEKIRWLRGETRLWDEKDLTSWSQLGRPVRVVRSLEQKVKRERIAGEWTEREVVEDWQWAVIFPDETEPPAELIRLWGHARWDQEERGFCELTMHWHLKHSYYHHPTARLALLLILFLAFFLTTVFFGRNLKPAIRKGKTRLHLAHLLADDMIRGGRASFWARPP